MQQVRKVSGVHLATLKSPKEGLLELKMQEGMQDVLKYLPENPLPAVIDVVPAIEINSKEKLQKLIDLLDEKIWIKKEKFLKGIQPIDN